jgi:hypothetical protein
MMTIGTAFTYHLVLMARKDLNFDTDQVADEFPAGGRTFNDVLSGTAACRP